MYKSILIPVTMISLVTLGVITQLSDQANVEYYEKHEYMPEHVLNRYNKKSEFYAPQLAKTNQEVPLGQLTASMQKYQAKPQKLKTTEDKKTAVAGDGKKTNFTFGDKKKQAIKKAEKRTPSKSNIKDERKLEVPENLPQVPVQVYSTFTSNTGDITLPKNTNAISSDNDTSSPTNQIYANPEQTSITTIAEEIPSLIITKEGLAAVNLNIKEELKFSETQIKERMQTEMHKALSDFFTANPDYGISLNEIKDIEFVLADVPFGLESFQTHGLSMKFPLQGSWNIKFIVSLHYENEVFTTDEDITFALNRFSLNFPFRITREETGQINIVQHYNKQLSYDLNISSSSFLTTVLFEAMNAFYPDFIKDQINTFVDKLALDLKPFVNKTLIPLRANIPSSFVATETNQLEDVIQNIDKKIQTSHLNLGSVHALKMQEASNQSWSEAYQNSGEKIKGQKVKEMSLENSAKLTGYYLASLAYKYRSQSRQENQVALENVLKNVANLFKIHNDTGLIARSIMPLDSQVAQDLIAGGEQIGDKLKLSELDGVPWLAYQGAGISFDQYQGILFGLVSTFELVEIESIKNEAKRLTKIMVDYLIANKFITDLDKKNTFTPFSQNGMSFWNALRFEKIAFLLAAEKMYPGQYEYQLSKFNDLKDAAWLSAFHMITDPVHQYSKFENALVNLHLYFDLSEAQDKEMLSVVQTLDYYLAHHKNVFFNLIIGNIQKTKLASKSEDIKKGLYKFLERPHRKTRTIDLSTIETVNLVLANGKSATITTAPLNPEQMVLESEFLWSNSAQIIDANEINDPTVESIGIDATLPYWMGMNLGIF